MTIEEIRKMTVEDLTSKVYELKNELLSLRFQAKTGQLDNSNKITLTRKEFARVLTVVNERKKKVKNLNK
jgi:large subunit ribosomal protein L29